MAQVRRMVGSLAKPNRFVCQSLIDVSIMYLSMLSPTQGGHYQGILCKILGTLSWEALCGELIGDSPQRIPPRSSKLFKGRWGDSGD